MKVCIAGGGRVGRYLAQSLLANHHEIVIIEPVESQCRMLADMPGHPGHLRRLRQRGHSAHRRRRQLRRLCGCDRL